MRDVRGRYKLRTLVVAVAFSAVTFGGWVFKLRRDQFIAMADDFTRQEFVERLSIDEYERDLEGDPMSQPSPAAQGGGVARKLEIGRGCGVHIDDLRRHAEWTSMMKTKYRRAASRPWLAVSPDPPRPNLVMRSIH